MITFSMSRYDLPGQEESLRVDVKNCYITYSRRLAMDNSMLSAWQSSKQHHGSQVYTQQTPQSYQQDLLVTGLQ